ncbi:hypothetical protein HanPSC8_Chr11g0492501 [Helianthus annuus]|nr:hypothetical protein HanPSC8_Chr11g0492501 [Helianthus annuus]
MLTNCALFSKAWIEVPGSFARDVAKQLKCISKRLADIVVVHCISSSSSLRIKNIQGQEWVMHLWNKHAVGNLRVKR